ncbi:histone-lysine N-methyltransferase ASHR3 [Daucus carota subsp. sativus]
MYLVEKKRSEWDDDSGCEKCSSICSEDCLCRYQNMSCSKACRCSNTCTNRPFQKHKRIEVVKTKSCGWGAEAAEPINKGEFIVEYVGEVLSDDIYEERLRDMDCLGRQHFYMCKVDRDFTIDSTYKGNISRFLNHSCDPNCTLEKWQVNGETRMGIFAAKSIEEGEPLTYDYRFVQSGADVKCECGSSNCQGFLGVKKKARGGRKAR